MNQNTLDYPVLPLLPLRGLVVLPGNTIHFDVARKKSIIALQAALRGNQQIFLVSQRDARVDDPCAEDLYEIGTIAEIKQVLKLPGDSVRILVQGLARGRMVSLMPYRKCLKAQVEELPPVPGSATSMELVALVRKMRGLFEEYAAIFGKISPDVIAAVIEMDDPGELADFVAANIMLQVEDRQYILETVDPIERIAALLSIVDREIEILSIEQDIDEKTHEQMDKNQRDYYLREQIKVIQGELEEDDPGREAENFAERIKALGLPKESEETLLKEAGRFAKMPFGTAEATVSRNYLEICLELPWNTVSRGKVDLARARRILEQDHYGLEKVKARMLEYLAVRKLSDRVGGQVICLVGPPGVGKTSIASSIARAMGRKFVRVSLGGVRDEADIRGHRKTYIGSMPGRILNGLKIAGSKNPVMLLDEVDKMGTDHRGDPASALLEVFDTEQNHSFRDHFVEIPFDLSDVVFIATANTTDTIPRPLLDRMELIELVSYTDNEKLEIAKRHLLPKQLKKHGLKKTDLRIGDECLREIIDGYTKESGVRNLERSLAVLCRKAAFRKADGEKGALKVTLLNLPELLGPRKFKAERLDKQGEVGVANGLAWTSVGGECLKIEVAALPGSGKIELTGSLGDVMKESAKAAMTYIRSRASLFAIDPDFYKNTDIHIHVPEGAVPKDGPSAGITMATAILSALTGAPVARDVAMTGEITLRGRVLPIGGLREKTMAALKNGYKRVLIPADNEPDLAEIDQTVRAELEFFPVESYDQVYPLVFDAKRILRGHKPARGENEGMLTPEEPKKSAAGLRQ